MKKIDSCIQKMVVTSHNQGISFKNVASRLKIGVATVSKHHTQFSPDLKRQYSGLPGILSNADKREVTRNMISGERKAGKRVFKYSPREGYHVSNPIVRENYRSQSKK
ncbi:hypothetical protein BGZ80_008194, partial [Entomortierella chlamydospora]